MVSLSILTFDRLFLSYLISVFWKIKWENLDTWGLPYLEQKFAVFFCWQGKIITIHGNITASTSDAEFCIKVWFRMQIIADVFTRSV